jgi:hypothetical protein
MPFPAILAGGVATAIVAGLASGAVQIVLKVLFSLGFGYLTFTGADLLVTQNEDQVLQLLAGLSPNTVAILGVLKVGTCVKIMASALVMRLTLFGLNEGVIKRMKVVGT